MRHLAGHFAPRLDAVRPLQPLLLILEVDRHPVERRHEPLQLVADLTATWASKSPRAMRPVARVRRLTGSAMRSASSSACRAEQDEQGHADQNGAIEIGDLVFDLLLPGGKRHRQDGVATTGPNRRRGNEVLQVADFVLRHVAGDPPQYDGVIEAGGRRVGSRPEANRSRSLVASSCDPSKMLTS